MLYLFLIMSLLSFSFSRGLSVLKSNELPMGSLPEGVTSYEESPILKFNELPLSSLHLSVTNHFPSTSRPTILKSSGSLSEGVTSHFLSSSEPSFSKFELPTDLKASGSSQKDVTNHVSFTKESSIYDVLKSNGLPMGLLPKGVTNFTLDNSGNFKVFLDQACNAKFENELHYDRDVSGKLSYGQIGELNGISAQDLFLWFPVKEIRVDIPSSGLIYFDVGVVSKQFSLSSFESPRECLAAQLPDGEVKIGAQKLAESLSRKLGYKLGQQGISRAVI